MREGLFSKFCRERFGSGLAVANYFETELSEHAALIGVNWSLVSADLTWQSGKAGKLNVSGKKLLNGFKHSVGIFASLEHNKDGIEYPLVTFKNKGGAGDTVVFNGIEHLWNLFEREKDIHVPQSKRDEWDRKKRQREEQAARSRQAAHRKQEAENKRRAANVEQELQHFSQLPRAASFVYTDKKKIPTILNHVDARSGSDKHGNYIALQLHHIGGKPVGIQRIYDRHITKKDGSKTNKDFTWGMAKDGAHLIIGDLQSAERIYVVEGFATGGSVFMAMQRAGINCAVIVALDAGNMIKVVKAYQAKAPYLPLMLAVDNDMWKQRQGKGNAGMLVAMELLAEFDELKAWAPNFERVPGEFQPTDWNDLHAVLGTDEVAKQLKGTKCRVKCKGDLFEKALTRLQFIKHEDIQKETAKCVQMGMTVGMPKYRPSDIISLIKYHAFQGGIPKNRLDLKKLAKKAGKIFKAKVRDAQRFRSFSGRITRDDLRPDHITYTKFNKSVIDDEVLNHIKQLSGIVVVRFPMGSRKTQGVIKPLMWDAPKSAFFAHRVSLIGGAWDALNKNMPTGMAPVVHYQDPSIMDFLPATNKLACCINSSIKSEFAPLLNNLNVLCIDEAAQTLRHVTSGGAVKYPVHVFTRMLDMMASTREQVILADADANDTLVEFCELGLKQRNAHLQALYGDQTAPQQIHVIDGMTDCSDTSIYYTDSDTAFQKAVEDVAAGHRVLVANDSANDGEKLFTHLQQMCPEKKGLYVSLDTKESKEVEQFTDNPNGESLKYDYLIYSPSISSGVSIENGHFTKHYGIFCGTVAPSDAIQMIRRDRKAREFVLGLSTMHSSREESAMAMWLGMLLANDNQLEVELNKDTGTIELKTDNLDFDRFRLELIAQENQAKNDFANNLLCILYADGYKLHQLEATDVDKEKGQAAKEAARDMLKAIDVTRHLEQPTPNDQERDNLLNKPNLSRDEKAQLNRWDIEHNLMMSVDDDSIEFHHKGGMGKVRLFELLHMTPKQAREFDEAEVKAGVQPSNRTYAAKQNRALRDFVELAGWDRSNGQGVATEESLTAALEHLTAGDNIHMFNNWYKFGGYINPFSRNLKPVNKAKAIAEALGLKLDTKQLGRNDGASLKRQRYLINPSSWELMAGIHSRRQATHATAFKMESLDCGVIQNSPDTYIETEEKMDHAQTALHKGLSWVSVLKQAIENLRIPMQYAPKIMTELNREGLLKQAAPANGVQDVVSAIYQRIWGHKPVAN